MKVRPSVKRICDKCKIIRRHGVVHVICDEPEAQAAPGVTRFGRSEWLVLLVWTCRVTSGRRSA